MPGPAPSAGLATFASCNKAGSIPQFTRHLQQHPNNYQALMWRARAHGIVGNNASSKADFATAMRTSSGVKRCLAEAHYERASGNNKRYIDILTNTVQRFPRSSAAWSDYGAILANAGENASTRETTKIREAAKSALQTAIDIAVSKGRTTSPHHCWDNHQLGEIYFEEGKISKALGYFESALRSNDNMTIAHVGESKCRVLLNDMRAAERSFDTAKRLNPTLVTFKDFSTFRGLVESSKPKPAEPDPLEVFLESNLGNLSLGRPVSSRSYVSPNASAAVGSGSRPVSSRSYVSPYASASAGTGSSPFGRGSGNARGGGGGSGGSSMGGDGGGSDDDDDAGFDPNRKWKDFQKKSPWVAKYGGNNLVQSPSGKYWYSRDRAGHAGARYKVYEDKGSTLQFIGSADENMEMMRGKHESREGSVIKKGDLVTIRRK